MYSLEVVLLAKSESRTGSRRSGPGGPRGASYSRPNSDRMRRGSDYCLENVPGPNLYKLKNLVGYNDHDISKWREPAFSMGYKAKPGEASETVPGPKYNIGDTTRHGQKTNLAYSMGRRHSRSDRSDLPGPGVYAPEKFEDPRFKRAPSATIKGRHVQTNRNDVPSPADYTMPGGMGKSHPTEPTAPAAVILGRSTRRPSFVGPGPNSYPYINMDVTKKAAPMASMGMRNTDNMAGTLSPGPGSYNPQITNTRTPPAYSFGSKHHKCLGTFKDKSLSDFSVC